VRDRLRFRGNLEKSLEYPKNPAALNPQVIVSIVESARSDTAKEVWGVGTVAFDSPNAF